MKAEEENMWIVNRTGNVQREGIVQMLRLQLEVNLVKRQILCGLYWL